VQGGERGVLVAQALHAAGGTGGLAPPAPVVEDRHGVEEPGTVEQPRRCGRQQPEADQAERGGEQEGVAAAAVAVAVPDGEPDEDDRCKDVVQARVDVVGEHGEQGYGVDCRVQRLLHVEVDSGLEVEQPPPTVHRWVRVHADECPGEHVHAVQGGEQGQLAPPRDPEPGSRVVGGGAGGARHRSSSALRIAITTEPRNARSAG
jgi:hypothetical protein